MVIVRDCTMAGVGSTDYWPAFEATDAELVVRRCTFTGVRSFLYASGSDIAIESCVVEGVREVFDAEESTVSVLDTAFTGQPGGGGLMGRIEGERVEFSQVSVAGFGDSPVGTPAGQLVVLAAEAVFEGCVFEGNRSEALGGALALQALSGADAPTASLVGCEFRGNHSIMGGGAVLIGPGIHGVIEGCVFESNTGREVVGAVLTDRAKFLEIHGSVFAGNTATNRTSGAAD